MTTTTDQWAEFYKQRINSGYQDYFNKRYKPLLDIISDQNPGVIREEGIGIGSVSKALSNVEKRYGFDLSANMVDLCALNNPGMELYIDDIITSEYKYTRPDVVITHGVLEHFVDIHIERIFSRYKKECVSNIHYVPTNGYSKPSFGDERLLSPEYWLDKFKPKDHVLFNDNKDLLLINI